MVTNKETIALSLFIPVAFFLCSSKSPQDIHDIYLPDGCECIEIIAGGSFDIETSYYFRDLYYNCPILVCEGCFFDLGDTASVFSLLPYNVPITDIHWIGGQCYLSDKTTVYYGDPSGQLFPLVCSDGVISRFSVSIKGLTFVSESVLVSYSFDKKDVDYCYVAPSSITAISSLKDIYYFSAGSSIYSLEDNSVYQLFTAPSTIQSLVILSDGSIFFGTKDSFYYLDPYYNFIRIADLGVKSISKIGNCIYATLLYNINLTCCSIELCA